jgi:hypothetical protein
MEPARTVRIDFASAAETLPEEEVRAWAREQRVFISSVMQELKDERAEVARRIEALGAEAVLFERFGGRDDPPEQAYLHEVASSTIYLGILGRSYGKQLPSRYSATHQEYLEAEERGLRICVWVSEAEDREGHQAAFVSEAQTFHTTGRFASSAELAEDVERRLRRIAAEDLSPWVKLGELVFRAGAIKESGDTVEITARIRDQEILGRLEAMRPDRWGPSDETSFVGRAVCRRVLVQDVATLTTAGAATEVEITLRAQEARRDSLWDVTLSEGGRTYSPIDLTDIGLRSGLFGEETGLGELSAHMAEVGNPLQPLGGMRVPEEVVGPVARLLVTEALVCGGRASRISRFRLGPPAAGRRRLEVGWRGIPRHRGAEAEGRGVEGYMSWPPS